MTGLGKILRALVGVIVVVVLLVTVNSWYGQYKTASKRAKTASSKTSTSTVDATVTIPVQGSKLAVLADGPILHSLPATSTKTIRPLKKGELLTVVGVAAGNWLQIRDAKGKVGYVLNSSASTKIQK